MKYAILIDQVRSLERELNLSQACIFSIVHQASSRAEEMVVDGKTYYRVAENKIIEELPIVSDKRDTVQRILNALKEKGLVDFVQVQNKKGYALTNKGKEWNSAEINPGVGKKSDSHGKKSVKSTEKNPPNTYTITNTDTKDNSSKEEQPKADKSNPEINSLISDIKGVCSELKIVYDKDEDRNFAKHILTAKEFGLFAESLGKTRCQAAIGVLKASVQIDYFKGYASGPKKIYKNYAEIYNKRKQRETKSSPVLYSPTL